MILGHAHPEVIAAVAEAAARGTSYGAPTAGEVELAELVAQRMPARRHAAHDLVGHRGVDERDPARPRGDRPRDAVKFAGAYHGHVDGLLAEAGSGLATQGIPPSPGVPAAAAAATVIVPVERRRRRCARPSREHDVAALLAEPYPANMGLVPPRAGLPRAAARASRPSTARCSSSTR